MSWGDGGLALLYESWYKTRRSRVWAIAPDDPAAPPRLLWDRDYEDAYGDPGSPLGRRTALGTYVLAQLEGSGELLLQGASSHGFGARCSNVSVAGQPRVANGRVTRGGWLEQAVRRTRGRLAVRCWHWRVLRREALARVSCQGLTPPASGLRQGGARRRRAAGPSWTRWTSAPAPAGACGAARRIA